MCGIAGIYGSNEAPREEEVRLMTNAIIHRGPDGEGIWIDKTNKIGLGHRRLAIIDLTEGGIQPMHYFNKYVITFNGEIYNYIEIQSYLTTKGYQFLTKSDTEVIMAAYDHWGVDCLKQFDGMFAFALYNKLNNELFCARDRFGEKPFYYSLNNNKLMFASEMKSLWANGIDKSINNHSIYLYLNFNLHENPNDLSQTFFQKISKLKAGHYFIYKEGVSIIQKPYWKIDLNKKNSEIDFKDACIKFNELFFTSVNRRLRSDVSVGTSLSGGLDSSSVVLAIDNIIKNKAEIQKTFSARFDDPKLDEGFFMSRVVQDKSIQHYCTYPDLSKLMEDLPQIMYHQEEPFSSASIYAQWEVFKLAKLENVVVLLDGQGADEYLAGYTHFFIPFLREKYKKGGVNELKKSLLEIKENNTFADSIIIDNLFKLETTLPTIFDKSRKIKHKFLGVPNNKTINKTLFNNFYKEQAPFKNFVTLNESLYHSTFKSGLEKLLRFADRNSMAFSREVRLPFLNHELVEFVFSLPSEFKIRNGWTKAILRYSLENILPSEVCWRKDKLGFQPPQNKWEESKEWKSWAFDFHNLAIKKDWVNKESAPSWKTVSLGIFGNTLQNS